MTSKSPPFTRPPFAEALKAWKTLLRERGLPSELTWIFDDNLCFEKDARSSGGFRLAFQTALTPPPADAERLAYEYFAEFDAPVVFWRIGSCAGKSVCLLLCDPWFATKQDHTGFYRREEWRILFRPGAAETVEEIDDPQRWKDRIIRNRPLHELDFCMTLRGIHEILAHGRVLSSYEHYALRLLHLWHRIFNHPQH